MKERIHIGTSGYSYAHWSDGVFYPPGVRQKRWLEYYAGRFDTVELNVTFYRLPAKIVFEGWYKRTPDNFTFSIKGSRFITHVKRLKDCREPLKLFFENASGLKKKLDIVLWQLHPKMKADPERLAAFCSLFDTSAIARRVRHAFEFRHESWFSEEILGLLRTYNHALCIAHSPRWPSVEAVTADFIYLRFHGGEQLYGSNYSSREMREWAAKCRGWLKEGRDTYAYFNNDAHGFAAKNALSLRSYIKGGRS
jgi:uncharacterized protein YecE (DUF72 family)